VEGLSALGQLPGANEIELAIGLPLRNREALTNLLEELYNPASPDYRQYLTPAQFAERFGPTEEEYQKVVAFVESRGLRLNGQQQDRGLLNVRGAVADIERAFNVNLKTYRHPKENRTFFAPDAEPSLDLDVPLEGINGLDDFDLPRPLGLQASPFDSIPYSEPVATGSGPRGTFWGGDFRAAYAPGVQLDGTGQTVGLVAFDSYYPSDIRAYASLAGLPNVTLTHVLLNSVSGQPGPNNIEVALDIDMAIAMAPGLSGIVVYQGRLLNTILSRMATDTNSLGQPLVRQLSSSWGFGSPRDTTRDNLFLRFQAQGQSFFQASSDDGARCVACPPFPPTDNPFITVVGGSSLTTSGPGGEWVSETVWSGSGGGVSTTFPMPIWQQGLDLTCSAGSTTNRNFPDVAGLADAMIWLIANNGQQYRVGGTSASAPLWAGFAALVNQQAALSGKPAIGFLNPAIYAIGSGPGYGAAFHDITAGNITNTCCGAEKYFACPGYDLATGWGTPNGSNLIAALLAPPDALQITPATGFTASGPVQGPFNPAIQSCVLTNAGAVSLMWTQANTPVWLDVSPSSGTLVPGGPAATVTFSPNADANALPAGSYTAATWFTNLNNYFGQSRGFVLNVVTPPAITSQPANLSLLEGMTAAFSVETATNAQLFYQWQYTNGTTLSNLTDGGKVFGTANSTLIFSNVSPAQEGGYLVNIRNVAGGVTSAVAQLTVLASAPFITAQPGSQAAVPEQTVTMSVSAVGTPPLLYLWLKDGTFLTDGGNLSGTATSTLTIGNVSVADAGTYAAVVVNGLGYVLSSNALLTIDSVTAPGVTLESLYSFGGGNDGANPNGLVQGADGQLYGTTQTGGTNSFGTVFRMTTGGVLTPVWSFNGVGDGANPRAALVRAGLGEFYGTTYGGGSNGLGTIFKTGTNGGLVSLVSFDLPGSALPYSELTQGTDGHYYGTTYGGGVTQFFGTVYRMTRNGMHGTISNLYSFSDGNDGGLPYAGLARGVDGSLYGTTYRGGATTNGTVFRITTNGVLGTVASFDGASSAFPAAALALGSDGNFYGTTTGGGSYGKGAVFRVAPDGNVLAALWSFSGGSDGASPMSGLLLASDGALYGTTAIGGDYGAGTVFGITTNGALLTLVQFDGYNGANPQATLIQGPDGRLYGTTRDGGAKGKGVVFAIHVNSFPQITRQPVSQDEFTGADVVLNVGAFGGAPLGYQWRKNGTNVSDSGNLAGSATDTVTLSNVTLANAGTYSVLITNSLGSVLSSNAILSITSSPPIFTLQPVGGALIPGSRASFCVEAVGSLPLSYQWRKNGIPLADGTNASGSSSHCLTLNAAMEPDSGTYTAIVTNSIGSAVSSEAVLAVIPASLPGTRMATLHWFTGDEGGGSPNGLVQASNGSLYGTTVYGGAHQGGTIFRASPDGAFVTLFSLSWTNGALPAAALVEGADGFLYGTTEYGGDYGAGTAFNVTLDGELASLHSFSGLADGRNPYAALLHGADGNFYGTAQGGGLYDEGTIVRLTPDGVLESLYYFRGDASGGAPVAALVQGADGSIYGTTPNGGSNNCGSVFKLLPDGRLTNLYSFRSDAGSFPPAPNHTVAALVQGADGAFYGTTKHSTLMGVPVEGAIFKLTTNGVFTSLYAFNAFVPSDGWFPEASLIQGADGNFYGTTYGGGVNRLGTVFRVTPAGVMTTLVSFDGFDTGAHPMSALVTGTNGSFYGTTTDAGLGGHGTVFRLSFAPQVIAQPADLTVLAGANVIFEVSLFGSQPFSYNWRRNGIQLADGGNIAGSATSSLTLTDVSLADSGAYSVVVTNSLGSTVSASAVLTVLSPPVFQAVTQSNGAVNLVWSSVSGQIYQLQYKEVLDSSDWTNLGAETVATGTAITASDTIGSKVRRFYRVVLIP